MPGFHMIGTAGTVSAIHRRCTCDASQANILLMEHFNYETSAMHWRSPRRCDTGCYDPFSASLMLKFYMETLICDASALFNCSFISRVDPSADIKTKPSQMHRRHFPVSYDYMENRLYCYVLKVQ